MSLRIIKLIKTEVIGEYTYRIIVNVFNDGSRWNDEQLHKHHFSVDEVAYKIQCLKRKE